MSGPLLRGKLVTLRPFRLDELDAVIELRRASPVAVGEVNRDELRLRLLRSGTLADGRLDFAVEAAGELVGDIGARHPRGGLPPGVFEIGIDLAETARSRGFGTECVVLLTEHLFADYGAGRVQATTALWNTPMRRALHKAGFVEEGVLRGFMPHEDGGREDYAMYARLATDRAGAT